MRIRKNNGLKKMTENIIGTKYGKVRGIEKDGCVQFLGIPFAKKPLGELSFKHPLEPENWDGILDASSGSRNPIQHVGHTGSSYMSQDCLYMNLFVPKSEKQNLPVLVWIFGGSYAEGGAGEAEAGSGRLLYDMAKVAAETESIVVTFNYRLNLYGFLNLSFLDKENGGKNLFDKNCGLFDQIRALEFVRDNIGFFGGDRGNVTLFGQSAGGACILALMSMDEAKKLFSKAYVMSACIEHFFTEEESRKNTERYLKTLGIKKNELEKLFRMDSEVISRANKKFSNDMRFKRFELRCAFSPTIDGTTLKGAPGTLAMDSEKPLLIGTVEEEANPFTLPLPTPILFLMSKILKIKPVKSGKSYKHQISDSVTRIIYVNPLEKLLSGYKGDAWRYLYKYATPDSIEKGIGCYHFCDVPVLLGKSTKMECVDDEKSQEVGKRMRSILKEFVWKGNPGWKKNSTGDEPHEIR